MWKMIMRFPVWAAECGQPGFVVEGTDFSWDQGGDRIPFSLWTYNSFSLWA